MSGSISLVPLVLIPFALGAGLLGGRTGAATCWWFGVAVSAVIVIVGYGVGFAQGAVLGGIVGTAFVLFVMGALSRNRWRLVTLRNALHAATLTVFFLPLLCAILLRTLDYPALGADATVIWYAKAKALYEWVPFPERPFPNYPELGPAAWMSVLKWVGPEREHLGRLILVLPYFFWFLAALELFDRPYPWASAIVLPTVALLFFDFERFTRGDQDGLVMMTAGMAAIFLAKILIHVSPADRRLKDRFALLLSTPQGRQDCFLGAFFSGLLGLIKQEAAILGFIVVLTWASIVLACARPAHWRRVLVRLLPYGLTYTSLAVLWPLLVFLHGIDVTEIQGEAFTVSSVIHAVGHVDRWPQIGAYFADHYRSEGWVFVACLVLSSAAAWVVRRLRPALLFLWIVYGLHAVFVAFVFLATRESVQWHLETAFARLTLQGRFALAVMLCLTIMALVPRLPRDEAEEHARFSHPTTRTQAVDV